MTEIPVYWPIRGQDSPPLWESTLEDITDIADMTRRWHEIMESGVKSQPGVFTFQTQVQLWGANLRNMRDLSRTKDQEHVENDGSITISLHWSYGDCNTGLILVNSINSRLLTPRYLHFFTSKILVSALCSYAQTNISPYLDLARLRPEQIEIFIWAYLHTAYAQIWGEGGDAGRVATVSDEPYDIFGSDLMMISLYLLGVESNNKEDSVWRVARFRGRQGSIRDVQFWFIGPLSN